MAEQFVANIVHFGRILRRAGLTVGTDRIQGAVDVLQHVGISRRDDVHSALAAVLIDSHEHRPLFDAAFDAFWRDPQLLERMIQMSLPSVIDATGKKAPERPKRLRQALQPSTAPKPKTPPPEREDTPPDTLLGYSDQEALRKADFESMSAEEFQAAKRLAESIALPLPPVRTRRQKLASRGQIDMRRTAREITRSPDSLSLAYRAPRRRPPKVIILLDISGSMERYARLFLHFAHGLTRRDPRTQTFAFGTRLTMLTRALRHRDADEASAQASALIEDWQSGTRISGCLTQFNRDWARRVLTGNATVLLVTDGLDRDTDNQLGKQAALLSRFAARLVWLNPLLRFDGFEPKASGIRAILPHVDLFVPMHNLQSLEDLGRAFAQATHHR